MIGLADMTKKEIEDRINLLKSDYIRMQGDLEKKESIGGSTANIEKQLEELEEELANLKHRLVNA